MREQGISPISEVPHFRRLLAAFVSAKPELNRAISRGPGAQRWRGM